MDGTGHGVRGPRGRGGRFGQRGRDDPAFVLALFLLGQAALARRRWDEAESAFRRVVSLCPGSVAARQGLQLAVEHAGRAIGATAVEGSA
jgi:cytochrome c-type biogenesis protein CcmH/NrfG